MNGVKIRFLNRDEILPRLVRLAQELLACRVEILEISLFGSLVRGNYAPGSDADLYILLKEDDRRFADRIPEFLSHFSGVNISIDIFPYTLEEERKMRDQTFIKTIQEKKIVLASR